MIDLAQTPLTLLLVAIAKTTNVHNPTAEADKFIKRQISTPGEWTIMLRRICDTIDSSGHFSLKNASRPLFNAARHYSSDIELNKFDLSALSRMAVDEQNRQQMVALRGIALTVVSIRSHPADSNIQGIPQRKWHSNRKKLCFLCARREGSAKNDFDA